MHVADHKTLAKPTITLNSVSFHKQMWEIRKWGILEWKGYYHKSRFRFKLDSSHRPQFQSPGLPLDFKANHECRGSPDPYSNSLSLTIPSFLLLPSNWEDILGKRHPDGFKFQELLPATAKRLDNPHSQSVTRVGLLTLLTMCQDQEVKWGTGSWVIRALWSLIP